MEGRPTQAVEGFTLTPDMEVNVCFTRRREEAIIDDLDINPHTNPDIMGKTIVIFSQWFPPNNNFIDYAFNTEWMVLDETGAMVATNDKMNIGLALAPSGINLPSLIFYEEYPDYLPQEWKNDVASFKENFVGPNNYDNENWIVLAEINIQQPVGLKDYVSYDVRTRGGGIKTARFDEAIAINQGVQGFWDRGNWDGLPYPGHATYLIEVPSEILKDAGGYLTQKKIRDTVQRHTAAGVYPVIVSGLERRLF